MSTWKQFLTYLGEQKQVFIVGPMLNQTYHAQGPTIFVDRGANFRGTMVSDDNVPSISVGDGDSSEAELDVKLPKDKNYSDLAYVLSQLPPTVRHVELLGFLGGRADHQLINFGEVHHFLSATKNFTTVRFDESIVAFAGGNLKINIDGGFSVVGFEETTVTISGACVYSLNQPTKLKAVSSHGLSNRGSGAVLFASSKPCFVFLDV